MTGPDPSDREIEEMASWPFFARYFKQALVIHVHSFSGRT
jgi:hypothetical protein